MARSDGAEERIHHALASGDRDGATAEAVRAYGGEIYSFIASLHGSEADASDAFSLFCEGLWTGFERFEQASSVRTWAYAIARRCSLRVRRDVRRAAARRAPLPESSSAWAVAVEVRTATASYLATQKRSRIAELRAALPEEDRALLVLRVDRSLAWNDLARVLAPDESQDEVALRRTSARLRKRFQIVKERLYELGRAEGLVP